MPWRTKQMRPLRPSVHARGYRATGLPRSLLPALAICLVLSVETLAKAEAGCTDAWSCWETIFSVKMRRQADVLPVSQR